MCIRDRSRLASAVGAPAAHLWGRCATCAGGRRVRCAALVVPGALRAGRGDGDGCSGGQGRARWAHGALLAWLEQLGQLQPPAISADHCPGPGIVAITCAAFPKHTHSHLPWPVGPEGLDRQARLSIDIHTHAWRNATLARRACLCKGEEGSRTWGKCRANTRSWRAQRFSHATLGRGSGPPPGVAPPAPWSCRPDRPPGLHTAVSYTHLTLPTKA